MREVRPQLTDHEHQNPDARMIRVEQVIIVVDVVDIAIVVVGPLAGPGIGVFKPIPAILKTLVSAASASATSAALKMKGVLATEAGTEPIVRDATPAAARVPP